MRSDDAGAEPPAGAAARDPDAEAVRAVLQGAAGRYGEIVERHHRSLLRLVTGLLGDPHLAEDVAQEVWLLAYRRLESFENRARFRTWLHRIAVREALSTRNRVRRLFSRTRPLSAASAQAAPAADRDGADTVRHLLGRLPESERATFLLHLEGLRYDEIASALSCPEGTVGTRIHRARGRLAQWLGADAPEQAPEAPRAQVNR